MTIIERVERRIKQLGKEEEQQGDICDRVIDVGRMSALYELLRFLQQKPDELEANDELIVAFCKGYYQELERFRELRV